MVACMAVMAREAWTDERLDDFREEVNRRFDEVDKRFDRVEAEMKSGFAEVNRRIDSMQRTMIICFSGMTASIVASVVGAILVTQL
jgi:hypothetical protein